MTKSHLFLIFFLFLLQACGGGGGSAGSSDTPTSSKPDLSLSDLTNPSTAIAGTSINLGVKLSNIGSRKAADSAGLVPIAFYLSQDNEINPLVDIYIGWFDPTSGSGLDSGTSISDSKNIILPTTLGSGEYYLGAYADPRHVAHDYIVANFPTLPVLSIDESSETNNSTVSTSKINITGFSTCSDDTFEDDDEIAKAIGLASLQSHNFCYDQLDLLKFNGIMGNAYKVTVSGLSNTHISIRDDSNKLIQTAYESSLTSELAWTSDRTQTYTIEVSSESIRKGNLIKDPVGIGSNYTVIVE